MTEEAIDLRKAVESGQSEEEGSTIKPEEVQYTEIEEKAMADGWIPPDRFNQDEQGKDFITAEKFVENGSFFKKINTQKERIEQLEKSFNQLNSHYEKVAENEHKKAEKEYKAEIVRLKAEKVTAINEGEGEKVVQIESAMEALDKPEVKPDSDPVFDKWVSENKWYTENQFLSIEADMVAEKYLAKGLRGKNLLDAMTDHMKISHKDHFAEPKPRAAAVEGDTRGVKRQSGKSVEKDLTPDEREVFKNFERMNLFKDDKAKTKYFAEVIELRE